MKIQKDDSDELTRVFEEIGASEDVIIKAIITAYWRLDEKEKAAIQKMVDGMIKNMEKKKTPG